MTKLIVFGGSGFLGSRVCKNALDRGWKVTSISRNGKPAESNLASWAKAVRWVKADVFDASKYAVELADTRYVVHTIGILDYRGFLKEGNLVDRLNRLGSTLFDTFRESVDSPKWGPAEQLDVYDRLNREAAITVSDAVAKHSNVDTFVYVSAADGFPGVPKRYISTKRQAETHIDTLAERFRPIYFRPGFMFSSGKPYTRQLARLLGLSYAMNSATNFRLPIGAAGTKPLSVERVAAAIVEACEDARVAGPVEVPQIEALADRQWRRNMIV